MVRRIVLGLVLIFLVGSCAQIGVITGGDEDVFAPKPLEGRTIPQNASLNLTPKRIEITFDEFIKLNSPSKNIKITPETLTAKASIRKKTLILELEGEYLENTTYAIMLNGAIQDINENNDSLMYYVFSTGGTIDELTTTITVNDGFTRRPLKEVVVGLYKEELEKKSETQPIYLSKSTLQGTAKFNYLRPDNFYAYAFEDENKNGKLDFGERAGRLTNVLNVDAYSDTTENKVFISDQPRKLIVKNEFKMPGYWECTFNQSVDSSLINPISPQPILTKWNKTMDTLRYYYDKIEGAGKLSAEILKNEKLDTLIKRYNILTKPKLRVKTNLTKNKLPYGSKLKFEFNDVCKQFGYTGILVDGNSLAIGKGKVLKTPNDTEFKLDFDFVKDTTELIILPNTLKFANAMQNDTLKYLVVKQKLRELGNLTVQVENGFPQGYIELLDGGNVLKHIDVNKGETSVAFEKIPAGSYNYRFVYDVDKNRRWTEGNIYKNYNPERVVWFSEKSTVRANWDVEAFLKFD